jgi:hypothetical protein
LINNDQQHPLAANFGNGRPQLGAANKYHTAIVAVVGRSDQVRSAGKPTPLASKPPSTARVWPVI